VTDYVHGRVHPDVRALLERHTETLHAHLAKTAERPAAIVVIPSDGPSDVWPWPLERLPDGTSIGAASLERVRAALVGYPALHAALAGDPGPLASWVAVLGADGRFAAVPVVPLTTTTRALA
jgi:hypothetical protein